MRRTLLTKASMARRGFTVVELLIVIVVLGGVFPLLLGLLINTYKDTFFLDDGVKANAQMRQALWYMDDSIRVAGAFRATVPNQFADAYGPHNLGASGGEAWSYKGDSPASRVLIVQSYATTVNPLNTGRQPVFIDSSNFNCTTQMYYQPQLTFITIYFVKDKTLYKRILTDTTTPLCSGNTQQQRRTCPAYITSGRHASCQANDETLLTNVGSFSVSYYQNTQDGAAVPVDPAYTSNDPDILSAADYALVTLATHTKSGRVTGTITQRMTKVNQQ